MKTKKILQINSFNRGSTGNIMLEISNIAEENGYISFMAFPSSRTNKKKEISNSILIGNVIDRNLHLMLSYHSGLNGCFSNLTTKKFLKKIEDINPDIIHLHNLHNSFINLKMLFNYIKVKKIPVIWTLHDCWAFTGQCTHFTVVKCQKWENGCFDCPQYKEYPSSRVDKTRMMYELKKEWFNGIENLTIVTPSYWLAERVKSSFLKKYPVEVINNGIDLKIFKPTPSNFREKHNLINKKILLGVASSWSKRKGLDMFIELEKKLDETYKVVLVGLSPDQIINIPSNILGLGKTNSKQELAEIYTAADYFINPSLEETMGLVTAEALACGTPAIVSNQTAVPEMVDSSCGVVVEKYDSESFYNVITDSKKIFSKGNCVEYSLRFDLKHNFMKYINQYNKLVEKL